MNVVAREEFEFAYFDVVVHKVFPQGRNFPSGLEKKCLPNIQFRLADFRQKLFLKMLQTSRLEKLSVEEKIYS